MHYVANVVRDGSMYRGLISEPRSSRILVFIRQGEAWEPHCVVQDSGPNLEFPACFAPVKQITDALDEAHAQAQPIDFEIPDHL
jgi:hypothetical protein